MKSKKEMMHPQRASPGRRSGISFVLLLMGIAYGFAAAAYLLTHAAMWALSDHEVINWLSASLRMIAALAPAAGMVLLARILK